MAGEAFMETDDRGRTVRERQTAAPERAEEKPVTTGATKAILVLE